MSIKTVHRTNLKVIKAILSKSVIFVRFESGAHHRSSQSEFLEALRFKTAKITTRENAAGIYQISMRIGNGYSFHAYSDLEKAREKLPERLFLGGKFRHKVSGVLITDSDTPLFPQDEEMPLSRFENLCFKRIMSDMRKVTEICVLVSFTNGHEQPFYLELSPLSKSGCMGLAHRIDQDIQNLELDDAFSEYEKEGD